MQAPDPQQDEEPTDFGAIPFDDSDDEQQPPPPSSPLDQDDSLLQLSTRTSDANNISGLTMLDEDETNNNKRKSSSPNQKKPRRRKRRKVVIDNDETELSTEHIKNMIANTEDIVQRQSHPAEPHSERAAPKQVRLTQPFLADDEELHPALQALWRKNFWRALEEPCDYERQEPAEDVEHVRRDGTTVHSDAEEEEMSNMSKQQQQEEEEEEPTDFGQDFQMDEEEEEEPPAMDDDDEHVLREQQGRTKLWTYCFALSPLSRSQQFCSPLHRRCGHGNGRFGIGQ